ncbi:WAS/WASL-interacting protein family member 1-like [Triticum dicoccoides]|uniref:WAS/WASL-interacting protein family member 1-like n=1 Tax=Triticum dicoccoides TaxID=85692 RepID=UPI00188F842A|nr:WAS/WASL-interacting protein family member 1-like [Triticum dicoccoides]
MEAEKAEASALKKLEETEAAVAARRQAKEVAHRRSAVFVTPLNSASPPSEFTGQSGEADGEFPVLERGGGDASKLDAVVPPSPPLPPSRSAQGKQPGKLVIELLRPFRSARQVRPRPHARTNPISIPSHSRRRRHPPLAPAAGIRPATSTAGPPPRRAESAEASASQAPPNLPPATEDRSLHRTPETILPQSAQFPPVYSSGFPSDVHRPYYLAAGELPADYRYVKSQGDKQLWYKNAAHLTSDCAPERKWNIYQSCNGCSGCF